MVSTALIVVIGLIVCVWVLIEVQRLKHKIFAIILIALILFGYFSFTLVLNKENIDYTSFSGLMHAGKVYFSWLGGIFSNFKTMTSHAISLDWYPDESNSIDESSNLNE